MGVNDKPDDPFANVSKAIAAGDDGTAGHLPGSNRKGAPKAKGEWVCPVPADAPDARASHNHNGKVSASWRYCDAEGRLIHWVCRFDKADGTKEVLPQTLWREAGRLGWRWGAPPVPRPLYGLDRLASAPAAPVLIVEGEKTADAAARLFPGFAVASWSGGSKAVGKADWMAVAGRRVAILPDADTPGREAAQAVRKAVLAAGAEGAAIVQIPATLPDRWDCADPFPPGFAQADLLGLIGAALQSASAGRLEIPFSYTLDGDGLYWLEPGKDGADARPVRLSDPFEIMGEARDGEGGDWGLLLQFRDRDGVQKRKTVKRAALASDERMGAIETAVNAGLLSGAARGLNLGGGGLPSDPAYTEVFASFLRRGEGENELHRLNSQGERAQINAALSVGTDSAGGYLAPVEWDRMVHRAQLIISPMRRLSNVVQTSVGGFSTVWSDNGWVSGWVGETAARPTTANPTLSTLSFNSGEIYANVAITQRLLDDSALNVEEWVASELSTEFTRQEGLAFITGNGVNKPFGLLAYAPGGVAASAHPAGALGVTNSGHATTIPNTDILITFAYELSSAYRQNATWLMNSTTAATIAKMKDGQGNYIWREGFMAGQPATLLGYPVEIDEGMPAIAADAFAIAFGDFRTGYLINDRLGTRILRDPFTNKPFVQFYATRRVGAGLMDPNAIRLLKIAV